MLFRSLVLVLSISTSALIAEEATKFQFDGTWKPKGAMLRGEILPPPVLESITLIVEKNRYDVTVEGEDHSDSGTIELDVSTTPMRMTIKSEEGPNKGKTILAIYEIKNANAMRVCYDLSGEAFPKEFKAPKGTQHFLVGYRRQMPHGDSAPGKPDSKEATEQSSSGVLIHKNGLLDASQAFAYSFCINLRDHRGAKPLTGKQADYFRSQFLDRKYLEKHGLLEGDLPLITEPFEKPVEIRISDDLSTIAFITDSVNRGKELFLFRTVVEKGDPYSRIYVSLPNPPDPETGFIQPWIMRVELDY